jgi:hypothetical protein
MVVTCGTQPCSRVRQQCVRASLGPAATLLMPSYPHLSCRATDPANFTLTLKAQGLRTIVNTHDVTGVDHCQGKIYASMAAALGVDARTNSTVQCALQNETYAKALYELVLDPLRAGPVSYIDWFWTDWGKDDGVWCKSVRSVVPT